jgi:hypothetical protein
MGSFLNIFIAILSMSILLSIAFPGSETQFLKGSIFDLLLGNETINPLTNETEYTDLNADLRPEWAKGGNEESSLLTKFLDGLSIIKTGAKTLINIAALPITISLRMEMPVIIKMLIFFPLSILYIISAVMTVVRGVSP